MHKLAAARCMRGLLCLGLTYVHPQTFWALIKTRVTWKQARKGQGRRRISPERLMIDCNRLDNESFGHPQAYNVVKHNLPVNVYSRKGTKKEYKKKTEVALKKIVRRKERECWNKLLEQNTERSLWEIVRVIQDPFRMKARHQDLTTRSMTSIRHRKRQRIPST